MEILKSIGPIIAVIISSLLCFFFGRKTSRRNDQQGNSSGVIEPLSRATDEVRDCTTIAHDSKDTATGITTGIDNTQAKLDSTGAELDKARTEIRTAQDDSHRGQELIHELARRTREENK